MAKTYLGKGATSARLQGEPESFKWLRSTGVQDVTATVSVSEATAFTYKAVPLGAVVVDAAGTWQVHRADKTGSGNDPPLYTLHLTRLT